MDKETLKQIAKLIFDTAEEYFASRPLIVVILNLAESVVIDVLLDKIFAQAQAKGLAK